MTTASEEQITIHLDPGVKKRLQAAAECKGLEVTRYCLDAIERELAEDEADSQQQEGQPSDFEGLFAFRDALLGDRRLSKTGLEYLDEARAIRAKQMEDW